ncbi:MAG: winged helix-turn-helix domain-containing protein [Promethearchaeota archaeon]
MGGEDLEIKTLEKEVFKALDHQIRRNILRYIGENKETTFTEILNTLKISDSPTLSYHLKTLSTLIIQVRGKYTLSPIGKSAYSLLLKTTMYNKQALFMKRKTGAIIGNIVLWLSAIAAGLVMGVDSFMTTIILPSLAASSLMMIDKLFE